MKTPRTAYSLLHHLCQSPDPPWCSIRYYGCASNQPHSTTDELILPARESGYCNRDLVQFVAPILILATSHLYKFDLPKRGKCFQRRQVGKVVVLGEVDIVQNAEPLDAAGYLGG
jgi:hypothetical protein